MSLRYIGPIAVSEHGNPSFTWAGDTASGRHRNANIGGTLPWPQAQQLSELLVNTARTSTVGPNTGIIEVLWFDDPLLGPFSGWYILKQASHGPMETQWSLSGISGPVPISMTAVFLGAERTAEVGRSARALANAYGILAASAVANPWWNDDAAGGDFLVNPGGTRITREYDPTSPHGATPVASRRMALRTANVAPDPIAKQLEVDLGEGNPPLWVRNRGGDVRAFDLTQGHEVGGPTHPFAAASDILVTNGLVRFTVGARGATPAVSLEAYHSTTSGDTYAANYPATDFYTGSVSASGWIALGTVTLDATDLTSLLSRARLVSLTPDVATVALRATGLGDIYVSLHRGEPQLRIRHGLSARSVVATRRIRWTASPAFSGSTGPGEVVETSPPIDLPRLLTALDAVTPDGPTFSMSATSAALSFGAGVVTSGAGNAVSDLHAQLSAAWTQELRIA